MEGFKIHPGLHAAGLGSFGILQRGIAEAGYDVVVYHADRLHERVADGGSHEIEAAFLQGFTHGVGMRGECGKAIHGFPGIYFRASVHELPYVAIEGAVFFLHLQQRFGILHGGGDFQAVADDARVLEELREFALVVSGHAIGIEIAKGGAVVFAFVEYCLPAESGLRTFENQEFKQGAIIVDRNAPFFVVIADG